MEVLFSIIIPIYNEEEKLNRTLDHLIFDKYSDYEVILVNDGSTDRTGEICSDYERKYSFIHVINQNNQGGVIARKNGIINSLGKYIVFVDADDLVEQNYLELLHNTVKKKEDIYFLNNKINQPGKLKFKIEKEFISDGYIEKDSAIRWVVSGMAGAVWDKIYEGTLIKEAIKEMNLDFKYGDDVYINLLCLKYANLIFAKNISPYLHIRDSKGSICNSLDVSRINEIEKLYIHGRQILEELNVSEELKKNFTTVEVSNYSKTIVYFFNNGIDKKKIYDMIDSSMLLNSISISYLSSRIGKIYYKLTKKKQIKLLVFVCKTRSLFYKICNRAE
mgnify:FL=1